MRAAETGKREQQTCSEPPSLCAQNLPLAVTPDRAAGAEAPGGSALPVGCFAPGGPGTSVSNSAVRWARHDLLCRPRDAAGARRESGPSRRAVVRPEQRPDVCDADPARRCHAHLPLRVGSDPRLKSERPQDALILTDGPAPPENTRDVAGRRARLHPAAAPRAPPCLGARRYGPGSTRPRSRLPARPPAGGVHANPGRPLSHAVPLFRRTRPSRVCGGCLKPATNGSLASHLACRPLWKFTSGHARRFRKGRERADPPAHRSPLCAPKI